VAGAVRRSGVQGADRRITRRTLRGGAAGWVSEDRLAADRSVRITGLRFPFWRPRSAGRTGRRPRPRACAVTTDFWGAMSCAGESTSGIDAENPDLSVFVGWVAALRGPPVAPPRTHGGLAKPRPTLKSQASELSIASATSSCGVCVGHLFAYSVQGLMPKFSLRAVVPVRG